MFCKYCGNVIDGDSVFCKTCGKNITAEIQAQEPVTYNTVEQESVVVETPCVEEVKQDDSEPQVEYNESSKAPTKKRKFNLAALLLPLSMLVAGITKIIIANIPQHIVYIFSLDAFNNDESLYWIVNYVFEGFSELFALGIIVLCALSCKGLTKRLVFVASAYAGSIAYMFVSEHYYWRSLLWGIIDYSVAEVFGYIIYILSIIMSFALSVIIAMLLFKKLSGYEPKPLAEGKKGINIKKLILPCGLIMVAQVLYRISFSIEGFIYDFELISEVEDLINIVWPFVTYASITALLLVPIFIAKDKFKALTCLASAAFGYWIALWTPFVIVGEILTKDSTNDIYYDTVWALIRVGWSILVVVCGLGFYILLNRKEMEKVNKKK